MILIFSISAGLKSDFLRDPRGERGGVLPLEKLEVEVDPLWLDDRLSRLLELSMDSDLGASWVSAWYKVKVNDRSMSLEYKT